ncbi:lipopolysaccharide assembly protein LapB [Mucilaginibacter sp. BT774]|uniref:tetratricopeptide repeat protein n=1 Tax=Mucilaginibacter sp. BT774 TaxID=3062276 RepID=UPI0026769903|nr:tetratricopeptide repeat protein [Mucilaginibacter sp. BT774]MDO3626361.1 tetratricopeptide repeat protein [Mucilaginibacter sp. BT774]
MKPSFLLFILILGARPSFAQQNNKSGDALLLEYYQNQHFADALDYLRKTYPEPVTDSKILSGLAYTSQMAGKLGDAEGYYLRIYQKDSSSVSLQYNLGNLYLRRGNNGKALIYFKQILLKDSTNFNVYKQLATISYNTGDLKADSSYLQKANQINPIDPDVAADLATIFINQKSYPKADTIVSKALNADTSNLLLLHQEAIISYHMEKFQQTITLCQQLIAGGFVSGDVINMLGISYFTVKRYNKCISAFEILETNKTASETSYYYTAMSYKALHNQDTAIVYLNKAIKKAISSNVDSYYSEMGDSYEKIHKLNKAVNAYQKSLLYDSKPMIIYYVLANLYDSELKNKTIAVKYYRKYVKTNPPQVQSVYLTYAKSRLKKLSH